MSQRSEAERLATEEDLSALMDGELDSSAVAGACRAWRDDARLRSQWHVHHLIGDVMRSEDLVSDAKRDARFLEALRSRLAEEPVVLAPSGAATVAVSVPARVRRSWMAPAAVAAGFAVVAGTLVVTQMAGGLGSRDVGAEQALAQATTSVQAVALSDKPASGVSEMPNAVINGQLVRDARLDEYLAAHKKFGGSSLPGGPSGFLRNASVEVPAR
ncbi:sigma-E factor negative regulatory protein [Piscinibacter gummiphilus]|uniref:Sigma-E factor negative regulatory protein n=1 Tax=Piscinibacter gummiphilus TaxID=946333 RepID=A0ABZ0CWX5_9BURK|nr:sigma-E factor negative regulatory protein [Piscinibacter gummiphilus]WOB09474.1 sigma-E factor negative regulatory protein [Piscinibacter gummiphilus]